MVEDAPDAAETLAELLETWGHDVRIARTGPEALDLAPAFRPDVVLLDIGLPGMDGYEVAERLRQDEGVKPASNGASGHGRAGGSRDGSDPVPGTSAPLLVALTGYGRREDRKRAAETGFDLHFTKPVDPNELRMLLDGI